MSTVLIYVPMPELPHPLSAYAFEIIESLISYCDGKDLYSVEAELTTDRGIDRILNRSTLNSNQFSDDRSTYRYVYSLCSNTLSAIKSSRKVDSSHFIFYMDEFRETNGEYRLTLMRD